MTIYLKQSTASQEILLGPFLDDTDGKTAETGLTIANTDIKIWKNGATTEASKNSGGATHIASGRYYAVLDATDTNTLGPMEINVHVSGALPVRRECCVLAANIFDSLIGGGDLLDVNVSQFGNANGTFASGRPEVNATHWGGTAVASALVRGNLIQIAGAAVNTATAQLGVNVVNAAGTAWESGAITAASIATDAITAAKIAADAIGASELAADAVAEIQSGLATASALATVDGVVDAILLDTAEIGAAGAGLTAIPWNAAWDAEVQSEAADALNAYDPPTKAELDAGLAALNDIAVSEILAAAYEGSTTVQDFLRLVSSALLGKVSGGATTTNTFRDLADSKDRITATVDGDGNRTAVTLDAS